MRVNTTTNIPLVSPLADMAWQTRDVRDQKLPAQRIVCHITGTSTFINAAIKGVPPLDHLEDYFDDAGRPFAQYSVDPWGRVRCHALETETPWAQGWDAYGGREKLFDALAAGSRVLPEWWQRAHEAAPGASSVAAFRNLFRDGTPNDRSVAVEFIQWQRGHAEPISSIRGAKIVWIPEGKTNYKLTIAQYLVGNMLLHDIALRHRIAWPEEDQLPNGQTYFDATERFPNFLGHEDCDPWGRGTKSGGWDPGALRVSPRFCWWCMLHLEHAKNNGVGLDCMIPTPEMPSWAK